jgi:hypothetical protein
MRDKESACLYLVKHTEKHELIIINIILMSCEYGRNALLTTETGREYIYKDKRYRNLLINCDEGLQMLMKNSADQKLVYEYMKTKIVKSKNINGIVICPFCREENDSYYEETDDGKCCICFDNTNNVKFTKCIHYLCIKCLNSMTKKKCLEISADDYLMI